MIYNRNEIGKDQSTSGLEKALQAFEASDGKREKSRKSADIRIQDRVCRIKKKIAEQAVLRNSPTTKYRA